MATCNHRSRNLGGWVVLPTLAVVMSMQTESRADQVSAIPSGNRTVIGNGYLTSPQRFMGSRCLKQDAVDANIQYTGWPIGNIKFELITDREKLHSRFGMQVQARARFGAVGVDAAANFVQESMDESYSSSATFEYSMTPKDATLRLPPGDASLEAAAQKATSNGARFRKLCGDQLVTRIESGAKLFITIRATFLDHQAKTDFTSKVKLDQGFNSLSANISKLTTETRSRGAITVAAMQIGGDPRKLLGILGSDTGDYPILNCSLLQIDACEKAIKNALAYATGSGSSSFIGNVTDAYDPKNANSGLADLVYHTTPWSDLGIDSKVTLADDLRDDLIANLAVRFDVQRRYARRVQDLLYPGRFNLCEEDREALRVAQTNIQSNLAQIARAADRCYSDEVGVKECQNTVAGLDGRLVVMQEKIFQPSPCFKCGPMCDECYEYKGKPTCLSCTRKVSDFLGDALVLTKEGHGGLPVPKQVEKNIIPGVLCTAMRSRQAVSVRASGTFGTNETRYHNDGWDSWIQYGLVVPGQVEVLSNPSTFKGPSASIPITSSAMTDDAGSIVAAATWGYCQHFVGHGEGRGGQAHQIYECPVRFGGDFQVKVDDVELRKQLGR